MKRKWNITAWLFVVILLLALGGCKKKDGPQEGEKEYQIYYLNKNETKITSVSYFSNEQDSAALIEDLLGQLQGIPQDPELKTTISTALQLGEYNIEEGRLNIDFGNGYMKQEATTEVLVRAAIVRTLCQVEEVSYVTFSINQDALVNRSGNPVGVMNDELFLQNTGNEINAYEKVQLTLYFADASGKNLKKIQREEVYNSNISLEKLVVDKVINGPLEEEKGGYPTIAPNTKVLSVTAKDGVCYVNLDGTFQTQEYSATAEVTIYSLVNSLTELNHINKVQISIDGEAKITYREVVSLEKPLERNLELVKE